MVSPYLLRPVRALEDALKASKARAIAREAISRSPAQGRAGGTVAATLRQQGRFLRPRVVWVNDTQRPIKRRRKKD